MPSLFLTFNSFHLVNKSPPYIRIVTFQTINLTIQVLSLCHYSIPPFSFLLPFNHFYLVSRSIHDIGAPFPNPLPSPFFPSFSFPRLPFSLYFPRPSLYRNTDLQETGHVSLPPLAPLLSLSCSCSRSLSLPKPSLHPRSSVSHALAFNKLSRL